MFPNSITQFFNNLSKEVKPEDVFKPLDQTQTKNANTTLLVIVFIAVFMAIVIFFFPSFQAVKIMIGHLGGVTKIIGYLIFLIVLFNSLIPPDKLYEYSKIILPMTLIPGFYLFYREITQKALSEYAGINTINFSRIRYTLLYFCFIVFLLIFYCVNPGGYVTMYFGPTFIFSILLLVFGFLYLLVLFVPEKYLYSSGDPYTSAPPNRSGFFKGVSWLGTINVVSFLFFLILLTYGIYNYPNDNPSSKNGIIFGTVLIFLIWVPLLIYTLFPAIPGEDNSTVRGVYNSATSNIKTLIQRVALILIGLTFSGLLVYLIVASSASLTSTSGIGSFILNLIIIIVCLGILFKIISSTEAYQKSHYFKLIVNVVLYIPCILVNIVDYVVDLIGVSLPSSVSMPNGKFSLGKTKGVAFSGLSKGKELVFSGVNNIKNTNASYFILLLIILIAYAVYFGWPYISDYYAKQGGLLLINQPIFLNEFHTLGSYQDMNQSIDYDYTYGISFWFYLDDNVNTPYNTYTSLLNFGGKPNVLYEASGNTIMVTMLNTTGDPIPPNSDKYDTNGNYIVCIIPNIFLQKWNNMIINYSNGTLDIFYNGNLVKSFRNAVAEMTYDTLTSGADNGVSGGICNVNYFKKNLSSTQIYSLYNLVKDKTPPVTLSNDTTIQQINTYITPVVSVTNKATSTVESSLENTWNKVETGAGNTWSNLKASSASNSASIQNSISNFFLKK